METVRTIAFWVGYLSLTLIKLPITCIAWLILQIEMVFMNLMARLVEWSDDEELADALNGVFEGTASGAEILAEEYRDLKIEL